MIYHLLIREFSTGSCEKNEYIIWIFSNWTAINYNKLQWNEILLRNKWKIFIYNIFVYNYTLVINTMEIWIIYNIRINHITIYKIIIIHYSYIIITNWGLGIIYMSIFLCSELRVMKYGKF